MKTVLALPADVCELELSGIEIRVLLVLLAHADKEGWCYPSQTRIAKRLKRTRGRITETITSLEEGGHIHRERRGRSNAYQLAERFLVAPSSRRPARSAPSKQGSFMLPFKGGASAAAGKVSKTVPVAGAGPPFRYVSKTEQQVSKTVPRKRVHESGNPSSSTESVAARARRRDDGGGKKVLEGLPARSARLGGFNRAGDALPAALRVEDEGAAAAKAARVKDLKYQHFIARLVRYVNNRFPKEQAMSLLEVVWSDGPEAKRVRDRLEAQRKAEGWNDAPAPARRGRACASGMVKLSRVARSRGHQRRAASTASSRRR